MRSPVRLAENARIGGIKRADGQHTANVGRVMGADSPVVNVLVIALPTIQSMTMDTNRANPSEHPARTKFRSDVPLFFLSLHSQEYKSLRYCLHSNFGGG